MKFLEIPTAKEYILMFTISIQKSYRIAKRKLERASKN